MLDLIGNLLFEHLDKFQAYATKFQAYTSSSVCETVESQFFLGKEFCK